MNSLKLVLLFLLFSQCAKAQHTSLFRIDSLVFGTVPSKNVMEDYNASDYDWYLKKINNNWYITDNRYDNVEDAIIPFSVDSLFKIHNMEPYPLKGKKYQLFVDSGWLVGTNKGEWGGHLYWISFDKKAVTDLGYWNIEGILKVKENIIVLEGLCHLGMRDGHVLQLRSKNRQWKVDTLGNIESCPRAFWLDEDTNLWIITNNKVLLLNAEMKLNTVAITPLWEYLYPSSMIKTNDYLYIAMRQGVIRYNLKTGAFEWGEPIKFKN